jgi:DNA-binding protein YbaB
VEESASDKEDKEELEDELAAAYSEARKFVFLTRINFGQTF